MKTRFCFVLAVTIGTFAALSGCSEVENKVEKEKAKPAPSFVSAEVTLTVDRTKNVKLLKTFNDEAIVTKLAGRFPGVGQGNRSETAGSWEADAVIIFKKKGGEKVRVSTNYKSWSEGQGDWEVEGEGLEDLLKKLFE